mmetsp:Transcript_43385/g.94483  ORF Transcript_43385/g.94483 Transcript_43385/m.94483 type:complete len:306 (+) Transcript_43385:266-1183(+)
MVHRSWTLMPSAAASAPSSSLGAGRCVFSSSFRAWERPWLGASPRPRYVTSLLALTVGPAAEVAAVVAGLGPGTRGRSGCSKQSSIRKSHRTISVLPSPGFISFDIVLLISLLLSSQTGNLRKSSSLRGMSGYLSLSSGFSPLSSDSMKALVASRASSVGRGKCARWWKVSASTNSVTSTPSRPQAFSSPPPKLSTKERRAASQRRVQARGTSEASMLTVAFLMLMSTSKRTSCGTAAAPGPHLATRRPTSVESCSSCQRFSGAGASAGSGEPAVILEPCRVAREYEPCITAEVEVAVPVIASDD